MTDLKNDVKYVKGVGPSRAKSLNKLGIYTLEDLITYFPRGYEDRSQIKKIVDLADGEKATIEARAISSVNTRILGRNKSVEKLMVTDETDNCTITWFNQTYISKQIKRGGYYRFFGKVNVKIGLKEMMSPVFDEIGKSNNTGKIIPSYSLIYEIKPNTIRRIIQNGLEAAENIEETVPNYIVEKYNFIDYNTAIHQIHFPDSFDNFKKARRRLVFDELLAMQLGLLKLKGENNKEVKGIKYSKDVNMSDVINDLPFKLTGAQTRVLEEINKDMESDKPMNRLLQGDVGSGKTIVALISAYKAVKSGYQAVILAPTMILANQHLENCINTLGKYGIECVGLVGGMTAKQKRLALEKIESGEVDIIIGTHAILEENVVFNKLGLVVTDEQHRFGVKQRSTIVAKGDNPDVLVMSATPIPRTLALILYGDLDISIIDELPPNRKKIETVAVSKKMETRVNNFIREQVDSGRQAYIVCPLVEESENIEDDYLISATELAKKYQEEVFKNYRVECLHGKMRPKEKDEIMQRFKNGEIDILVSTTVIEVGVDVPNASLMVIENAERFGLAQLHQLRGRVGRGEYKSYCVLKYTGNSQNTRDRMETMVKTENGMIVAEKDLELRGSGDFFGTAQHGLPEFKIANLFNDVEQLKEVQALAIQLIGEDPTLSQQKNKKLNKLVESKFTVKEEITI
ncbi:MAG: ATP-dependent DNA helicase RecG [Clostridia bacterium]|nr:ATP-dependent DNA helicase RecG [Clostridia bacterium]